MKEITFNISEHNFSTEPDNSLARQTCVEEIQKVIGKTYAWFHEETGNKNWVLYNPNEYCVNSNPINHLQFEHSFSDKVQLPINASSCYSMFAHTVVSNLDLSEINTSKIVNMEKMFYGAILNANFRPVFDTSNVKTMSKMFMNCEEVEKLDLSQVNANKVKYADCMFEGCSTLAKLNLTGLKMEGLLAGWYMFKDCYNLKEILVTDFPNRLSDEQKNSMFKKAGVGRFTLVAKA